MNESALREALELIAARSILANSLLVAGAQRREASSNVGPITTMLYINIVIYTVPRA